MWLGEDSQTLRIGHAEAKQHQVANITKDRFEQVLSSGMCVELSERLIRERQVQAEFSRFREQRSDTVGHEILKLIHVKMERLAAFWAQRGPSECGGKKLPDEQHAEQPCVEFAELAFGEIDQQDAASVEQAPEINRGFDLSNNRTNRAALCEQVQLARDVWRDVGEGGITRNSFSLVGPKSHYLLVRAVSFERIAERLVIKNAGEIKQRGVRAAAFDEEQKRVAKIRLKHRSTALTHVVELIEDAEKLVDDEVDLGAT